MAAGHVAAVVLAAGAGTRMQREKNKVFLKINGVPILRWSLRLFDEAPSVDRVILVAARADLDACRSAIAQFGKVSAVVEGGAVRHESEVRGLMALATDIDAGSVEIVLVHDAVRPFASVDLVERLVTKAKEVGAVVPGVPVGSGVVTSADGQVTGYPSSLYAVQTPQAFRATLVLDAHRRAQTDGFIGTDTASVVERLAVAVEVLEGSYDNIKVTTPDDLVRGEAIAEHITRGAPGSLLTVETFGA